jgi:ATP-binding cassette subfamily F protein uup
VLLAAAFVADPDILLLDEPTNHLDIETIAQLEALLLKRRGALVFVTHDRSFLRRIANRILDLDRGRLRSYGCAYEKYLERRDAERAVEAEQAAQFDKKLALEEAWIRKGVRARRTRNEGRVRALFALREERRARRSEIGAVRAELQEAERSGRIVLKATEVSFCYSPGEPHIARDVSTTVLRGDRVGIIGPNGCGKTTLISLLLGSRPPDAGTITHGARVEIAHFEQLHDTLDDAKTVMENVGEGRETISFGGRDRHVMGYLQDFLFSPEEIRGPVRKLSGGERRRLQLARVLSRPSNVLILDEPTNDLDLETLELMEDLLMEFTGTLFLISHDREFLNNVVTSTLVFEGDGRWSEYAGGYDDWARQAGVVRDARAAKEPSKKERTAGASKPARTNRSKKLTFKEARELEALPATIEDLETERTRLYAELESPDFYRSQGDAVAETTGRVKELAALIETAYARWEALEAIREAATR